MNLRIDSTEPVSAVSKPEVEAKTERLDLMLLRQQHTDVLRRDFAVFTEQFGFSVAEGAVVLQPESKDAMVAAEWDSFLVIGRADQAVVGMCGCRKAPDAEGAVEIAYGIAPGFQGRGLATEAAQALVKRAFLRDDVKTVIAHTLREHNASTRVLTKCGFERTGEAMDPDEGVVWKWALVR